MCGGGSQTQTTTPDPLTQQYRNMVMQSAMSAAATPYQPYQGQTTAGVSDLTNQAVSGYQGAAQAGQQGLAAMAGDPAAVAKMMNPYSATMDPYWNQLRQQTLTAADDRATAQGAFGGARTGVTAGQGLADIANAQAAQRYGEYGSAMDRAGTLTNLGMTANNQLAGMGDYYRNIQQQALNGNANAWDAMQNSSARQLAMLTGGMMGGAGAGSSTTQQTQSSPFSGLLGALMLGASFI